MRKNHPNKKQQHTFPQNPTSNTHFHKIQNAQKQSNAPTLIKSNLGISDLILEYQIEFLSYQNESNLIFFGLLNLIK
jgi:hypothetical protein